MESVWIATVFRLPAGAAPSLTITRPGAFNKRGGLLNGNRFSDIFDFPRKSFRLFQLPGSRALAAVGSGSPVLARARDNRGDSLIRPMEAIDERLARYLRPRDCLTTALQSELDQHFQSALTVMHARDDVDQLPE